MQSDIERMAKDAGFDWLPSKVGGNTLCMASPEEIAKFAALVAEDCAMVCAGLWGIDGQFTADEFAAAIRAKFALSDLKDAAK